MPDQTHGPTCRCLRCSFAPGAEPRAPKPAQSVTLAELKRAAKQHQPTGFKTVGGGTVLVYTDAVNYYVSDGTQLRAWLWRKYGFA